MGFIGKMVDKIKGSKKELTQSEIAEKKVEELGNLLSTLNQKSFQIRRMSSVYDQQVERSLANLKQNPKNEYLIASTKNTLKYLFAKKKAYERFGAIIDAVRAQVETKYAEASLTRGEEIIDSKFCNDITKIYSACDEYASMIDSATSIGQLEDLMKNFSNSLGVAMGFNSDDEVDALINDAIGVQKETKTEKEDKKEKTKEEVDSEKILDSIRKGI